MDNLSPFTVYDAITEPTSTEWGVPELDADDRRRVPVDYFLHRFE